MTTTVVFFSWDIAHVLIKKAFMTVFQNKQLKSVRCQVNFLCVYSSAQEEELAAESTSNCVFLKETCDSTLMNKHISLVFTLTCLKKILKQPAFTSVFPSFRKRESRVWP